MTGVYIAAYFTSLATFATWLATQTSTYTARPSRRVLLITRSAHISVNALLNMCIVDQAHVLIILAWSSPIMFELFVLGATCWNAIDRPRQSNQGLASALRKDGLVFFLVMTILRLIQVGLMATRDPAIALLGGLFVAHIPYAVRKLIHLYMQHHLGAGYPHGQSMFVVYPARGDPKRFFASSSIGTAQPIPIAPATCVQQTGEFGRGKPCC
jgi:hypothetical protein